MTDSVRIEAVSGGFDVSVDGTSMDALALRRLTNQFSFDAPVEPSVDSATYHIVGGRIRAVVMALAPILARAGIPLLRDAAVERELAELRHEVGVLGVALKGELAPTNYVLEDRW